MSCEERLMKNNVINKSFTVAEIQGGVLKTHLIEDDYLAPHKVINNFSHFMNHEISSTYQLHVTSDKLNFINEFVSNSKKNDLRPRDPFSKKL